MGARVIEDIEPRYEFRVWGEDLTELRERLARRATPVKAKSKEIYLVSKTTDNCNAKIRGNFLDIKVLVAEYQRLEQWKPVLRAAFPLDRSIITTQVFFTLEIRPPQLSRAQYDIGEFINEVIAAEATIAIVELFKNRLKFSFETYQAEFTVVLINDVEHHTVAVESADPDKLLRLIHEIGCDGAVNVSYVRYIKRVLAIK